MNKKQKIIGAILGLVIATIGYTVFTAVPTEIANTATVNDLTLLTDESVDEVKPTEVIQLQDGDTLDLVASIVKQKVGNRWVKRLAYNGQIPGPVLKVDKGAEVTVNFTNNLDMETALHSHGLRGAWQMDGAAPLTQDPIPVGSTYTYELEFPDTGVFWYHPHVREDYQQEMGLYGNFIVEEDGYWNEADSEAYLIVDDVLEDGEFKRDTVTKTLMGRFGDRLLINDSDNYQLEVEQGLITRAYITNVANTRTFDLSFPGAEMKLVGGDNGRIEREVMVDNVILGTSERSIVELYYPKAGTYDIEHRGKKMGEVIVRANDENRQAEFSSLRSNTADYAVIRDNITSLVNQQAEKELRLTLEMDMSKFMNMGNMNMSVDSDRAMGMNNMMGGEDEADEAMREHCQMMPQMAGCEPYLDNASDSKTYTVMGMEMTRDQAVQHCQMMPGMSECDQFDSVSSMAGMGDDEAHDNESGIEWEDDMAMMNAMSNNDNVRWIIEDEQTGDQNSDIDWNFTQGEMVKVRITNDEDSMHPMQHPIHFHGQRFVVLTRDGEVNDNLQWKDTVLIPTGQTVELLVEMSNPGLWMAHCHIAEHLEADMMFNFTVADKES